MIIGMITCLLVGIMICVIGVMNLKGNISPLHSYHRQRVAEENVKPMGRLVGIGMLIIGVTVITFGVSFPISEFLEMVAILWIGEIVMFLGMAAGIALATYAIKKYNGGLF